jgi:hypothetical protein
MSSGPCLPPLPNLTLCAPCQHRAVDTPEFAAALVEQGYTKLVIQKGAGEYFPNQLVPEGNDAVRLPIGLTIV